LGGNEREVMSHSFLAHANGTLHERPAIVVIDRHSLSRSCLARVLRAEFQDFTILELETAKQFDTILGRQVSLVTLDIGSIPVADEGLLQNLACIHRSSAEGAIILLTSVNESAISDAIIAEVMRYGVKGYITASASIDIALAAFSLVIAGGIYFPRSDLDHRDWAPPSFDTLVDLQPAADADERVTEIAPVVAKTKIAFTERERQVLATLLRGMSNKVIANELKLSQNTVKSHISRIMHKLHARNRTEAVILSQSFASITNGGDQGSIPEI